MSAEANIETDRQAILDLERGLFAAEAAGDLDAWMNFIDDDPVWLPPNKPAMTDRRAIREWAAPYFELYDLSEETTGQEIRVAGDWGYIMANWTFTVTPKEGGKTITDDGKSIWIVRRQQDGTWRPSRAIWNSDIPPATSP